MDPSTIKAVVKLFENNREATEEELRAIKFEANVQHSSDTYKRPPQQRIFVNRSLRLDKINYFGFDMDYTLAMYTPAFEELSYRLIVARMVEKGYPAGILDLPYDASFSIRGLFLDKELGNFLKIDNFGNIVAAVHGKRTLIKDEIAQLYPSMLVHNDDIGKKFYLLNTMFNIPEACVFANLVEFFETQRGATTTAEANPGGDPSVPGDDASLIRTIEADIYYKNLFADVRAAMDWSHLEYGNNKPEVLKNPGKYIMKTPKLATFFDRLRKNNKKTFLLTNSPWEYTNAVMSFLLNDERPDEYKSWLDYFDFVIVSAEKPAFFSAGNTLREVDIETGRLKIGRVTAPLQRGKVYTGGNLELLERLAGIKNGTEVLYVGDHIFADVRVSKKRHGWRTLLVIPELEHELEIWANKATQEAYNRLVTLSRAKDAIYRDLTSETKNPPNIKTLRKAIQKAIHDKNGKFNLWFGSLFTSGLKQSFFAMQVQRYADIYTSHYYNLLEYPIWYAFTAEPSLLPHELYI